MPSDLPSICQERVRLLRTYSDAATLYAGKVREMAELAIQGKESESSAVRALCRGAWDSLEGNRIALARHEADHICDRTVNLRSVEDLDSK
jgi:hypothetical protein